MRIIRAVLYGVASLVLATASLKTADACWVRAIVVKSHDGFPIGLGAWDTNEHIAEVLLAHDEIADHIARSLDPRGLPRVVVGPEGLTYYFSPGTRDDLIKISLAGVKYPPEAIARIVAGDFRSTQSPTGLPLRMLKSDMLYLTRKAFAEHLAKSEAERLAKTWGYVQPNLRTVEDRIADARQRTCGALLCRLLHLC